MLIPCSLHVCSMHICSLHISLSMHICSMHTCFMHIYSMHIPCSIHVLLRLLRTEHGGDREPQRVCSTPGIAAAPGTPRHDVHTRTHPWQQPVHRTMYYHLQTPFVGTG